MVKEKTDGGYLYILQQSASITLSGQQIWHAKEMTML